MKKWPNKIYLQIEDQHGNKLDLNDSEGITWCQDRINKSDIVYYRAGRKNPHLLKEQSNY